MVRKQVYLTEAQDRLLKREAERLGVSEAAVVRQALDAYFEALLVERKALVGELMDALQPKTPNEGPISWNRDELYHERLKRWL